MALRDNKWVERAAWTVGLLGLYGLLLGTQTLDALDLDFPVRDDVRASADPGLTIEVAVRPEAEPVEEVTDALSVLPPSYVELVRERRARVELTNLEELKKVGLEPDTPISVIAGIFSPRDVLLLIAHDAAHPGLTALHEMGHFVDHALGDCSFSEGFDALWQKADDGRIPRYYLGSTRELFAYYFSSYYFSDRRRERLAEDHPEAASFFAELERGEPRCPE